MRVLILHDRFQFRGGAERLVLELAKTLNADILTEFWTEETYPREEVPHKLFVLSEGEPSAIVFRYFRAQWNFWWKTRSLLREYDVLVFSGNNCLSAAIRPLIGKKTVFYCHSPVRYVYDLLAKRRADEPALWKRILYYDIGKWGIRAIYRTGLARVQTVIANSHNVRDRLARFCHTDARVVYPPIRTDAFKWIDQGDFYLSFARVDALKRIDVIVRAFQQMPDKKLVIVSGGDELETIRTLAAGYANISVRGWVDAPTLTDLVGRAIATIYIPVDEDFGMSPVESMSAGKPCIGVNEGGLRETIIDGVTGTLIPVTCTEEDVRQAVQTLTPERAFAMRTACEQRAATFSTDVFTQRMRALVTSTRVAIDASRSGDWMQKTGVERASDGVIKALADTIPEGTCLTYYAPSQIAWLPQDQQRVFRLKRAWTLVALSWMLWKDRPDVLFVPVHTLPLWCPKRAVRIVHDVAFLRIPDVYKWYTRLYMRFDLWRTKRVCETVFVPTEAVKRDLITLAGFDASRVVVTGFGMQAPTLKEQAREKVILYVGRLESKKNVAGLLRAFATFHKEHPDWRLVLIGKPGQGFADEIQPLLVTPGVTHLGYVSEEEKWAWLSRASVLAHVSLEEGFAFPVLEAFAAGVPVLASDIPTLREVGGDACEYVSPTDIEAIARMLGVMASDDVIRNRLMAAGKRRVERFQWSHVAALMWSKLQG